MNVGDTKRVMNMTSNTLQGNRDVHSPVTNLFAAQLLLSLIAKTAILYILDVASFRHNALLGLSCVLQKGPLPLCS